MNRRPTLIPYTLALHTGNTTWSLLARAWSLPRAAWVTCNDQPVDLTTMGFPRPYTAPEMADFLVNTVLKRREQLVRDSNTGLTSEAALRLWFPKDTP